MDVKKYFAKKALLCLAVFISYFILEVITFAFVYKKFYATFFMLDILFGLILTSPIIMSQSKKFDMIYSIVIISFVSMISILNINYYHVFGDMFSVHYISLAFKGVTLLKISYLHIPSILIVLGCLITFIVLLSKVLKTENAKSLDKSSYKSIVTSQLTLGVFLLVSLVSIYIINVNKYISIEKEENDEVSVDAVTIHKNNTMGKYGVFTYYVREIKYLLNNGSDISVEEKINEYLLNNNNQTNKFTGLLKDYNVLTIMIETGSTLMVNEYLTPNLYAFLNEGINCTNTSSKNKTNVSEMIGIVGSSPTLSLEESDTTIPFSLPSILAPTYKTIYVHPTGGEGNLNVDIYDRKTIIPQYGFEKCYFFEDLHPDDEIWTWSGDYTLDSKTMGVVADVIEEQTEKFYMFYTTLSMHGPYVDGGNLELLESLYLDKLNEAKEKGYYVNPLEENTESEDYKCIDNYMLACMDFDNGLKKIIDALKMSGKYDNTLVVLYGDHEIYYSGYDNKPLNFVLSGYDNDYSYYDMYQTVLAFSNPTLNNLYKQTYKVNGYSNFTSPYVIVPTILDLLGANYNSNFYLGTSIFDNDYNDKDCFYSLELTSFFNSNYFSYGYESIKNSYNGVNEQLEIKFLNQVKKLIKKQAYLDFIYSGDLFDKYEYSSYIRG